MLKKYHILSNSVDELKHQLAQQGLDIVGKLKDEDRIE